MQVGYFKNGSKNIVKCYRDINTQREYLTKTQKRGKNWKLVAEYIDEKTAIHFAKQHIRLFISSGFAIDKSVI